MGKLDDEKTEKVTGGKVESEILRSHFLYEKKTCDNCGKVLVERTTPLSCSYIEKTWGYDDYQYSTDLSVSGHGRDATFEKDHGLTDEYPQLNLCEECVKKKLTGK